MPILLIAATQSGELRPAIPIESSPLFLSMAATPAGAKRRRAFILFYRSVRPGQGVAVFSSILLSNEGEGSGGE
ncbi:MAG: hypothetical protein WCO26_04850 [Deltaproteobacteria bacterium]